MRRYEAMGRARRTLYIGAGRTPERRVALDVLEELIRELRDAVQEVARDLGQHDVSEVELVDLVPGSAGLVFEQTAVANVNPLGITWDAIALMAEGREPPEILTTRGEEAVRSLYTKFRSIQAKAGAVQIWPDEPPRTKPPTISIPALEGPHRPALESPHHNAHFAAESADFPYEPASPLTALDVEDSEWLVHFDCIMEWLDARRLEIGFRQAGKSRKAVLDEEMFREADDDGARWKTVRITAISGTPDSSGIRRVLHIEPAGDLGDEVATEPLNDAAKELLPVLQRFELIESLPRGWDSYSAKEPHKKAIERSRNFLLLVAADVRSFGRAFAPPFVAPTIDGGIQLEWERGDRSLELRFLDASLIHSFRALGENGVESDVRQRDALDLVRWYHGVRR